MSLSANFNQPRVKFNQPRDLNGKDMQYFAVIVAGGVGKRAGGSMPKQFVAICGVPMILRTLDSFHSFDPSMKIAVVMNEDYIEDYGEMLKKYEVDIDHLVCPGGVDRCESVINGLKVLKEVYPDERYGFVAVHDAARPLVDSEILRRGFTAAREGIGCVPVTECVNSLRHIIAGKEAAAGCAASESVVRKDYMEVQTPQIFSLGEIWDAYSRVATERESFSGFTDDASVAEAAGIPIVMYAGSEENIKVTHPIDFKIAEIILKERKNERSL